MMRLIDLGIGVQPRIVHDAVDEVIHDRRDGVDAAQPLVEGRLRSRAGVATGVSCHGLLALLRRKPDDGDHQTAVGAVAIAAAVAALQLVVEVLQPGNVVEPAGLAEVLHELVALLVNILVDVMRGLEGGVTEADLDVEGGRAHPERAVVIVHLFGFPETDMVTLGYALDRNLEGEVLLASPEKKVADRGGIVGLAKNRGASEL